MSISLRIFKKKNILKVLLYTKNLVYIRNRIKTNFLPFDVFSQQGLEISGTAI